MSDLPDGVRYCRFDGHRSLATRGRPVYGEPTTDGWRRWSSNRSKVAGMLDRGMAIGLSPDARVLYLGAASGTTVSHIADIVQVVYAIEFAPRPMDDLISVAETRNNVIPLFKDARHPETYGHVVESDIDVIIQDVATRDQAAVALENKRFLADDGRLVLAIKARSEDVTAQPTETFERVIDRLSDGFDIEDRSSLEPAHVDHLAVVGLPSNK